MAIAKVATCFMATTLASVMTWGCSTTPGDAAMRSNQLEAAAWLYSRGAENGDGEAALKLGLLIEQGKASGYGSAGDWYLKACDLGNIVSCHNSGVGFEYGTNGQSKNYDRAREAYRVAADQDYVPEQYNLGSLYANQYFNDDVEGLTWLLIAQRQASDCASSTCKWIAQDPPGHISKMRARMNPPQILAAERAASNWRKKAT
jgi:hypothetical protein